MKTSKLFQMLMLSLMAWFFSSCASEVRTDTSRHRIRTKTAEDNAIVAKSMTGKDFDTPIENGEDTDANDKGDGLDDQDDAAEKPDGAADADLDDVDMDDGEVDGGEDDGEFLDTDDDYLKDDGKGTPGQTPGQTPGKGDDDGSDDEDEEEDDVVVDLPEEACVYNDPANPNFTIPANQFGPALPPIAVPSTKIAGEIQADGETFIGSFSVFQKHANSPEWMSEWDGNAGRIPHHFTLVVTKTANSQCTAYLRHVAHDPRTLNGCFDQNTKIRMADGKDKIIALVTVGDKVWNPILGKAFAVKKVVKGPEADKPMYDIGFAGKVVRMTQNHPVPTAAGLKTAKEISLSDKILDASGTYHQVTVANELPLNKNQVVINLTLDTDRRDADAHMVLSEGIVTGDLFLQEQLEAAPKLDLRIAAARNIAL